MRARKFAGWLALAAALMLPGPAAAEVVAPPGHSEADQYFQTLPASAGPRTPDPDRAPGDAVREGALDSETLRALQESGEAGRAVADVVAATAPPRAAGGGGDGSTAPSAGALAAPEQRGLGDAFPLLLVAMAVAAGSFAAYRRRRSARG